MRIYTAGPMAKGVFADHMREAFAVASELILRGHNPYVPQLSWFLELAHHHPVEVWLGLDKTWLLQCEALYRIPGESVGADLEVQWAQEHGLKIFHELAEVPYIPFADREPLPEYRKIGG